MISNRDALRQTAADVSALVRAVGRGLDADGDGARDVRRDGTAYYGQSFGGIYGTLVGGVDPRLQTVGLNVPGGPITEIVRLSPVFRPLATQSLALAQPSLLNGGDAGFTESLPLAGERLESDPPPARSPSSSTSPTRPGSPAPAARRRTPRSPPARTCWSRPRSATRRCPTRPRRRSCAPAGCRTARRSTATTSWRRPAAGNPHGFLLNPLGFPAGFALGGMQMSTFLTTG